ncbi:hypothetical protein L484_005049 [Morus notabilis]|uniref:Uncharacterized protein n=1 Tax=Morus notabilis TaxID=981085 RepID=W9QX53_9ROSA|nr:hypothetical protein L484_005049 [Morus notabilis]
MSSDPVAPTANKLPDVDLTKRDEGTAPIANRLFEVDFSNRNGGSGSLGEQRLGEGPRIFGVATRRLGFPVVESMGSGRRRTGFFPGDGH